MNFIDSLSTTIEQLTRLIQRIEYFIDQMLNLTVDEMNNAIDSIQNQITDFYQDGLTILSSLDPVSLRQAVGYWTRSELRRRWISFRGRTKRGGRWLRGWGQRRYTWRPRHYQQEHNYTRQARADAIRINIRPGNVLMIMPPTQETITDILPLLNHCYLENLHLNHRYLENLQLNQRYLENLHLNHCYLENLQLNHCYLEKLHLNHRYLENLQLNQRYLKHLHVNHCFLNHLRLNQCLLYRAGLYYRSHIPRGLNPGSLYDLCDCFPTVRELNH
ncbi:hypothetical protein CBL_10163 [Carabus blaptoides fortunei]